MILGFKTQIAGKPTYFVEKIIMGLVVKGFMTICKASEMLNIPMTEIKAFKPKIHTIRDDVNDRWKIGFDIDFFINVRSANMFRFAPRIPVTETQEVLMTYYHSDIIQISIDDRELVSYTERYEFAINDGFDNWEDFFNFFYPKIEASTQKIYKGKLIHWTDERY